MDSKTHSSNQTGGEANVSALFDALGDGLIFFRPDATVLYVNRSARDILSSRSDAMISRILDARKNPNGEIMEFNGSSVQVRFFPCLPADFGQPGFTALLRTGDLPDPSGRESRKNMKSKGFIAKSTFDDIICDSPASREAVRLSQQYALTNSNILVVGESGSGKEVFVQALHNASQRRNGPFVAINCAALPENLLESELFGYVGGAFTGATRQGRKGYFELADKGTIFLDEIGEVSLKLQARLLRVIQEKEITRVGDEKIIHVDTRIISATNKDLHQLVEQKQFREDLYYRIDVLRIRIPSLRERREDIPTLIDHLLLRVSPKTEMHPDAVRMLTEYPWPGNIRQLNNLCERAVALSDKILITPDIVSYLLSLEDQSQHRSSRNGSPTPENSLETLDLPASDVAFLKRALQKRNADRAQLADVMRSVQNNKTLAAKKLGISRSTLWRKLKSLGLD